MRILTDILMSLLELGEAKVRAFKCNIAGMAIGIVLAFAGAILGLVGVGLLIASMFAAIAHPLGVSLAALLTGAAVLVLAGAIVGVGLWKMR